jgi:hypothetical protein
MSNSVRSAFATEPPTVNVIADWCDALNPNNTKSNIKLSGQWSQPRRSMKLYSL